MPFPLTQLDFGFDRLTTEKLVEWLRTYAKSDDGNLVHRTIMRAAADAIEKLEAVSITPDVQEVIRKQMVDFGEIPDRTSPEDFPDGYVLTREEIVGAFMRVIEADRATRSESVQWVMAAERMPDHGEDVIFLTSAGHWFGWRDSKDKPAPCDWRDQWDDTLICTDLAVLCWMSLPKPPEKFTLTEAQIEAQR